jgi:hypothetical protein
VVKYDAVDAVLVVWIVGKPCFKYVLIVQCVCNMYVFVVQMKTVNTAEQFARLP